MKKIPLSIRLLLTLLLLILIIVIFIYSNKESSQYNEPHLVYKSIEESDLNMEFTNKLKISLKIDEEDASEKLKEYFIKHNTSKNDYRQIDNLLYKESEEELYDLIFFDKDKIESIGLFGNLRYTYNVFEENLGKPDEIYTSFAINKNEIILFYKYNENKVSLILVSNNESIRIVGIIYGNFNQGLYNKSIYELYKNKK